MTQTPAQPLVTVVILSHQRLDALQQCLAAVKSSTYAPLEVIVVDNLSKHSLQIRETLKQDHPDVRLFELSHNRGFAHGMNVGIRAAAGEYAVLLADDIVLEPRAIETWVSHGKSHPDMALATGTLFQPNGGVRCIGGELKLRGVFALTFHDAAQEQPFLVTFAPGGFLLANTQWLRKTGGLREDFFMYMEDVELSIRAIHHGWKIWSVPGARARDLESPHNYEPRKINVQSQRNLFSIYLLHAGWGTQCQFYFRYIGLGFLKAFRAGPGQALIHLQAVVRFLLDIPSLLQSRRLTPISPEPERTEYKLQGAA